MLSSIDTSRPFTRRFSAGRVVAGGVRFFVAAPLADGRLIRLLEPWCEPFAGYHLYYPDRRGTTAFDLFREALRASRSV